MIKIPYGLSDFETVIEEGFFYEDRTSFIPKIEQWYAKYPIFLRPRRFGKSLFVSMLHYYYGLEHQQKFEKLFGNLAIGKNPTQEANSYLVLSFEFSRINTATHESTYQGFLRNVLSGARFFLSTYSTLFTQEQQAIIEAEKTPEAIVKAIFDFVKRNEIPHKIYVLIDEYDHFANELLSFDMERFKSDVSRNGFVRKFYESLKAATGAGGIGRMFITGVSPITMDSLTSGFNISDNISLNPIFHEMMGFTPDELQVILHQSAIPADTIPVIYATMKEYYDGYRFCLDRETHLFNPDMVLYFLKEYSIMNKYPYEMMDANIITDYRKVRNMFKIGGNESEKFELLDDLVKNGYIDFPLTRIYNLEANFTDNDFLSLLFYLGMLSIKEVRSAGWRFEIPNYVIKKLYFEYFTSIFLEKTTFAHTQRPIAKSIEALVGAGNPAPFFKIVEQVLKENHSNRDEIVYGEKHLQTLMIGLLFPFESYYIHSEYETSKMYPDIFLEKTPNRNSGFEIVLELKYVKKSAEKTLPNVIAEAENQLDNYMKSSRFARPDVKGFYAVFLGGEVYQWKEWGNMQ